LRKTGNRYIRERRRSRAHERFRTEEVESFWDEKDEGRTELNGERRWQAREGTGERGRRESRKARDKEREREGKGSQEVEVDDLSILLSLHPMAMKEP